MKKIIILLAFIVVLSTCTTISEGNVPVNSSAVSPAGSSDKSDGSTTDPLSSNCGLAPIEIPKLPMIIPGYAELDEATGLHMTGKVQEIDLATYRLKVSGLVDSPLELTYEQLRCMPKISASTRLICPGYFEDESTWSGAPLSYIFKLAGIQQNAKEMVLIGADGYKAYVPIKDTLSEGNMIAYEMLGQPLPILHGFPVRAVLPLTTGGKWIKWLVEIHIQ